MAIIISNFDLYIHTYIHIERGELLRENLTLNNIKYTISCNNIIHKMTLYMLYTHTDTHIYIFLIVYEIVYFLYI